MPATDTIPFGMDNPAVRDYLALTRLQVLTPLSLVINIATVLVCSTLIKPTLGGISRLRTTAITPNTPIIGIYILAIYLMQIGYCILLVLATKPETKKAMTKAVGMPLVFSNFVMALWAIAWAVQWFLMATILQGILLLLLLYSNIALLVYHAPTPSRPFDTALIHAPLRFFFILPFSLLFPLCLFIRLGFTFTPTDPGSPPMKYSAWHTWPVFGVVLGTNLLGIVVVLFRRDIVWTAAATWICVSIWTSGPKPAPVYITLIVFTVLHPLALIASEIYHRFYRKNRQPVILEGGDEHPGLYRGRSCQDPERSRNERGPREVNEDNIWSGATAPA